MSNQDERTRFKHRPTADHTKSEIARVLRVVKEKVYRGEINSLLVVGLQDDHRGHFTPWHATVATEQQLMALMEVGMSELGNLVEKVRRGAQVGKVTGREGEN